MPTQLENLRHKTSAELIQIFKDLDPGQKTLELQDNNLGKRPASDLIQTFKALPAGLTYLDLSSNCLGDLKDSNLCSVFNALPESLTSLKLNHNYFDKKSSASLVKILKSLPKGIILTLSDFDIKNRSSKELADLGKALSHIKEIRLVNIFGHPAHHNSLVELNKHIGNGVKEEHSEVVLLTSSETYSEKPESAKTDDNVIKNNKKGTQLNATKQVTFFIDGTHSEDRSNKLEAIFNINCP